MSVIKCRARSEASEERVGMRPIGEKRNDFMKSGPVMDLRSSEGEDEREDPTS